jgi:7-cyano-7-deazaguanine synthase
MTQGNNASERAGGPSAIDTDDPLPADLASAWPSPTAIVPQETGLLLSGGLDSAVLLAMMLEHRHRVVPLYIRTGCVWQDQELRAVGRLLARLARSNLADLVMLDMPMADIYEDHWSISGRGVPDENTSQEAVFLLGRNPLLLIKPMLWCQLHGVPQLAMATLAGNPFDDASPEFFARFETMMRQATHAAIEIIRPFERMTKRDVMVAARDVPLELTFSCLAPVDGMHCGRCNKCAERATAFRHVKRVDPTCYARPV